VVGVGVVRGKGVSCEPNCVAALTRGSRLTMVAAAAPGSTFVGWTGACAGAATCTVVAGPTTHIRARFGGRPGGSGYTTILASVGSEAEARRIQETASARGLNAGVLFSTDYRSLRPGFWVVFSGQSASKQDADRRTARAKSLGFAKAYPRRVSG